MGFLALLFSLAAGSIGWEIWQEAKRTHTEPADAAIVLGAAVWGNKVSPVFEGRLEHAVALYRSEQVQYIILTGGKIPGQKRADSEVAESWVVAKGIPKEAIFIETRSQVTWENLAEAKQILNAEGLQSALIVSDPLHMTRAMTIARAQNIDCNPSPTPYSRYQGLRTQLPFLAREIWWTSWLWLGLRL